MWELGSGEGLKVGSRQEWRVQSLSRRFISDSRQSQYRFERTHTIYQRMGIAQYTVQVSAVRLTPWSLVLCRRPFFHPTASLLSVAGLLLTSGCRFPRCFSFRRLRLSGGRDLSPAVGHRRYIPASTLPNRGRGTGGMPQYAHIQLYSNRPTYGHTQ